MPLAPARRPLLAALVTSGSAVVLLATLLGSSAYGCGSQDNGGECATPGDGCECASEGEVVECGETVSYQSGADEATCRTGKRTCSGGRWGACVGAQTTIQSVPKAFFKSTLPSKCATNPCDPGCMNFLDDGKDVDAGVGFVVDDAGGLSLTVQEAGTTSNWEGGVIDGGTPCVAGELKCQIAPCAGSGGYLATKLTGAVYDPAGKNPVPNVLVYVPNGTVVAPTDGVSCDSCATGSGDPIVSAITDYKGEFTLNGVPSGANIPLVIKSGKWQRKLTIPSVTACTTNAQTKGLKPATAPLIRFPKNRSEGSIPRMAFMSGNADPFECVLLKMGLDANGSGEFSKPTDSSGKLNPQRIHWYNSDKNAGQNLSSGAGGPGVSVTNLIDSPSRLAQYDAVILSCEGGDYTRTSTQYKNLVDYANTGGRVFATHFSYVWLEDQPVASQWPNTVVSWNHSGSYSDPLTTYIDRGFAKGENFAQWLKYVSASTTLGELTVNEPRRDFTLVDTTRATRWMTAWHDNNSSLGGGGSCTSDAACGAGLACNGGWCPDNTPCAGATGTCRSNTTWACSKNSHCNGQNTFCYTSTDKFCKVKSGTKYYLNKCDGGFCADGSTCAVDGDCGSSQSRGRTRTCTADTDCKGPNTKCISQGTSTTNVCAVDTGKYAYLGVCDGECNARSCTTNAECGTGNACSGGKCVENHNMEPLMTFNVPIGAAPAAQCGRVVYSDFHVSADARSGVSGFPASCNAGDLSAQEKALEYMLFDLTSCLSPDYIPTGSTGAYTVPQAVTRDYSASCPIGYRPQWHFFDWMSHTPADSKIEFYAQTGDTAAALAAMPRIGLAAVSGAPVLTWTGVDVAAKIAPTPSGNLLRITIVLYPSADGTKTPTLDAWRQAYTCIATE